MAIINQLPGFSVFIENFTLLKLIFMRKKLRLMGSFVNKIYGLTIKDYLKV